ncbi:MAG: Bax inhibitor-1/YccA family protein [Acholeplasmataceae bacterium]|nr:Bax inhibitor-1/YccA family protein [Acholeplasmataceae bacterium]
MRSSNPVFATLERDRAYASAEVASYRGIVFKTLTLFIAAALSGYIVITNFMNGQNIIGWLIGSMIVALIAVIVASRSVRLAMPFAFIYAAAEGVVLGFVTVLAEAFVEGAAITALIGTASIFLVMLFLYSSRTIRVTTRFRRIMYGVLLSILVFFILYGLLSMLGVYTITSPAIAIGISIFLIIFGALMLALDFDRAESIVEGGADKRYEWMVSVGLMVTLVWIYIEIIRLLIILSANRN